MRDAPLPEGAELDPGSLAACIATVLDADAAPGTHEELRPWLALRGFGLVEIAEPVGFAWPGPWVARVQARDGRTGHVVRYGVPSGTVWDPAELGADAVVEAGWVVAALDPVVGARRFAGPGAGAGAVEALAVAAVKEGPVTLVESVEARPGIGLTGDRYALGAGTFPSPGDGAALTLVAAEVLESFSPPLAPDEHRRNVVTRGVDLDALVGHRFRIGAVLCEGRRPAEPCAHLERVAGRPILRALVHRAGLRADILGSGTISVGDAVVAEEHRYKP